MMTVTLTFSEQPQFSMNVLQNNDYTPLLSKAYFSGNGHLWLWNYDFFK